MENSCEIFNGFKNFLSDGIIGEGGLKVLILKFSEGIRGEPDEWVGLPIVPGKQFTVEFEHFVSYAVTHELLNTRQESLKFSAYNKSSFLDFVMGTTYAVDVAPAPLVHYSFSCEWEIIDVVSCVPPKIVKVEVLRPIPTPKTS